MSKNRYVNTTFWKDNYVVDLDPSEKLLFLYLLTNPYTNIVGIYEISLREISFDTGFDKDMVLKILERFKKDEKIIYINGYIYLINFLKHQKFNPSSKKGAEKIIGEIKKSFWLELEENNKLYRGCIEALTYYNINSNINSNNNNNNNSDSDESGLEVSFLERIKKIKITKELVFESYEDLEKNKIFENEKFCEVLFYFIEMRKKTGFELTDYALHLICLKVKKFKISIFIKMIEQSIENNWKGIFELKQDENKKIHSEIEKVLLLETEEIQRKVRGYIKIYDKEVTFAILKNMIAKAKGKD